MNCKNCFKRCNKIEIEAFGQCGRCEAKDVLEWKGKV